MLTHRLNKAVLLAALMISSQLALAVAKEVVIPGGAVNAGQAISFTTLTGEVVPAEAKEEDGDLVVTIFFDGDASAGTLTVGGQDYAIPGGNTAYRTPGTPSRYPNEELTAKILAGGPAIRMGWNGGGDAEMGSFTSHSVELTGDGEFAIVRSDDSVETDGYSLGVDIPTQIGGIQLHYEQWDGDDRYGRDIPVGSGQFAIVNDNFLNGDPNGSTGACCDSGITTINDLELESERLSLQLTYPASWDGPGAGEITPHVGITLGSLEVSQRSWDAFVTPGLEGVNTRGDIEFDNDYYQLRIGADYALPFGERWGAQFRLGLGLQYSDATVEMRQDVSVFTPAGGTSVSDSESETSLIGYGGVGLYVNVTQNIRIDAGYYFDYQDASDPRINQSGNDLFVDNRTSTIDLESAFSDRFGVNVSVAIGGGR